MGLLDKVESSEKDVKKAKPKTVEITTAQPAPKKEKRAKKQKQDKKAKQPKQKKARPVGLSSEFEIAQKLSRVISWWVNFIANFAVLIAALFMSAFTGGQSGGLETTILFIVAVLALLFNSFFLPFYTGRNLGQYTSSTRYVRGDGSKPNFLHSLSVNNIGFLSLTGFLMVFTQAGNLSDGGTSPIVWTSIGAVFMVLWIVNWQFARNSDLNQGLFDLMFGSYLVRYVPEEKATGGFRARLESMSQFGEKYAKRVEDRAKAREEKEIEKAKQKEQEAEENAAEEDDSTKD